MKNYTFDRHWYLGFLGIIGIYKLPEILCFFTCGASFWVLLNVLWFLWFSYFIPTAK
ncbi:conserved hypothetical protein [Tenacibaculum litopenaei]|uniref:hypothetical protein n=1 Tax=Tenacibaculum litopenaei TaxID=396016 RepID=UPI003893CAA1